MKNPKFRGVRHAILEAEAAEDWLNQESVHRGLGTLYAVLSTVSWIQSLTPLARHLSHARTSGNTVIFVDPQATQAQNTWCMRQLLYIENCMGKSPIVKKLHIK